MEPTENRLLKRLPSDALKSLRAECELVELRRGDILCEPGEPIREVYFPTQGFVSLVAKVDAKATLEVAVVGDEGVVGIPLLLGQETEPLLALVQGSGKAWRMRAERFKSVIASSPPLRRGLVQYAFARLAQVAQNAICANAHGTEERLARRLLMMQDRFRSDHFDATHESLATMLGVRRFSVSSIMVALQRKKAIDCKRGTISVIDRKALEQVSCKCHRSELAIRHAPIIGSL